MKNISISLILLLVTFGQIAFADDYKVAVRAHRGIEAAIIQWQPTVDVISRELPQHNFTLVPILNLGKITEQAKNKAFDFVLTNPSSFVELKVLYQAKALVTLNNKRANTAQSQFGSVIFTHAKNVDILDINSLKNRTMMAVTKRAFGGWRVAWLEMLEQGFDPHKELKSIEFAKSKAQPEVVFAVLEGKVDAGIVRTDLLERLEAKGQIDMRYLRILNNKDIKKFPFFLSTKLYPVWAFASLSHVDPTISQRVTDILMSIKTESLVAIKGKYIGWIAPKDYTPVDQLMRKLKVGPYEE